MPPANTRQQIVNAANDLFYRQGFDHTSFADIAGAVQISRGNFYYHFKTKDEILDAVIETRLADTRAMIAAWAADSPDPAQRIRSYIRILITNWDKIRCFGCPVGTLTTELAKLDHGAGRAATEVFSEFRGWLAEQFRALGRTEDADELAMQVIAFSQGVATLACAFDDEAFMRSEVERMSNWLDGIAAESTRT